MHSDEGFALLFAKPDAAHLDLAVTILAAPVSRRADDRRRHVGRQPGIL